MNLKDKIGIHLDQIKQLRGIENAVLTQRDGNPIQSTGVWFSKEEIFNVCSATSAIFNVGIHLYPNQLRYILIEGKKAKILIAPLNNSVHSSLNRILEAQSILDNKNEFFIAITAQPDVNLGGVFLQTSECLKNIKTTLITSGETFKPPLIQYNSGELDEILQNFNIKKKGNNNQHLSSFSMDFSEILSWELKKVMDNFSKSIIDLKFALIAMEGGYILSKVLKKNNSGISNLDSFSAMSYSLYQTSNRCSWLLKRMNTDSILIDCDNSFQFINGLKDSVFSAVIGKARQKLGLIRLYLPQFLKKMNNLIKDAKVERDVSSFDFKKLSGQLVIK
ncbi:MAG: hypothetical protein GF317_01465 [Candidatus Lokiarchaeota archaeon]|nr:hypothetical protein [Candidatus Lokiarchaeota archaeon]MBD3198612.1 hypothetical protein [Candidatus Lokiarchaeota archaeon]